VIVHGALKSAYLAQLVTDWMGHAGQIVALAVSYRAIDYPGDRLTCRGRVVDKHVEEETGFVDLEVWLENGHGDVTTPGQASVALPVKAHVMG
jgi:acyl dehydratase